MCKKHSRYVIAERIKAADEAGELFYSIGSNCSKCGLDERYVKTRGCRGCAVQKKRAQRELHYSSLPCAVELLVVNSDEKSFIHVMYKAFSSKR
ncbi:hypothetical protein [Pseudoalteromonas marina]|uniref:Uncharacterized protein n=1 Tax=Pseudoalteromonas marina TaxID=267375 RepID=A0ABT9FC24_9GAMM|nr:hypothetical protein [Pseudoalteromonas marina]MDP2564296.1 hypothetical protein [Pseudoalteromonas marina]